MSLNYQIYWIDDELDYAESLVDALKLSFADRNINITAKLVDDGDEIEKVSQSHSLDLFVLDYNLDGRNGDELISILRSMGELTEIVFYSQDPSVYEKCPKVEGIHTCERQGAEKEISSVIEGFLVRNQNVGLMRGVIISEAIDLENKLTDIILRLFGENAELFKLKILNKPILDFSKKYNFVQSVLNDRIADEKENEEDADRTLIQNLEDVKSILKSMKSEIIDQRNILAHSSKSFVDGDLVLKPLNRRDSPIKFNDDWKNVIRSNIRKHTENLAKIRDLLFSGDEAVPSEEE